MKPIIFIVMPGLDPGIHGSLENPCRLRVDGRVKLGHDEKGKHDI
ncbi:MAG: hypothetical protein ACLQJR_08280 [Stellaceae bacterium]